LSVAIDAVDLAPSHTRPLGMTQSDAEAQSSDALPQFTQEEFYHALRRVVPEAEARQTARNFAGDSHASYAALGIPPELRPKNAHPVSTVGFISDDLLTLLSLLSDEAYQKVERFRISAHGGKPFTAEEQRTWEDRLAQFREWKDAGYPLDPDDAEPPSDDSD
jgi:hypothetical protein